MERRTAAVGSRSYRSIGLHRKRDTRLETFTLKAHDAVARLAAENRVIVLGGIAVVLHGLHRSTKDIDIWLDPLANEQLWADTIRPLLESEGLTAARVADEAGRFVPIEYDDIASVVAQDRFVRILGSDRPIDVFRIPNHLEASEFDEIWQRSNPLEDGTRLIDEIDLIVTKMATGRPHDEADMRFLQQKVENAYRERLRSCSPNEATKLFERFSTPDIAAFAATQAEDKAVRALGLQVLDDLCAAGDHYAMQLAEEVRG